MGGFLLPKSKDNHPLVLQIYLLIMLKSKEKTH